MDSLHDIEGKDENQKTPTDLPEDSDTPKQESDSNENIDDDEEKSPVKKKEKKGRRKIKIEFITDKSRRHITFSKRKSGIMKKVSFNYHIFLWFPIFVQ